MSDPGTSSKPTFLEGLPDMSRIMSHLKYGDLVLAFIVVAVLMILFLPISAMLLDFCLAISITFSVLILMTVLFIQKPLEFSAFPTILLFATMLRLALNISSTRLILINGHNVSESAPAGDVIRAFGSFVMQGNFVVGIIVFAILVLINFVVITKGSGRIAEVAARFSLDAMPGKQMAIDADLSAGLIGEAEARTRRKDLEDESNFFGAMDGAAKFVRGDAIAGLIITFINIIGGIIVGALFHELSLAEASDRYTLLTVGDGLVSQIPALVVSISAGILVSKGAITGSAHKVVFGQLGGYPKALGMTAVLLFGLSLLPGIPFFKFNLIAAMMGGGAFFLSYSHKKTRARVQADALAEVDATQLTSFEEPISTALALDDIRIELGYGLLPLVGGENGDVRLIDQIKGLRRQLAQEMGFILPSIRIQDNLQLTAHAYIVKIKEIEASHGDIRPNMLLCMDPTGNQVSIPGEHTTEPTFGLPATWILPNQEEEAHFKGYTVVDPPTVITTHLTEVIKDNMPELLSYTETQKLLDEQDSAYQKLIADVIPAQISVGGLQRVVQNLLAERVSIRDLPTILEGVSEACVHTRNISVITEHVRNRLARQLCESNTDGQGVLSLVTLSPEWEIIFAESIIGEGENRQLSMAPTKLQGFIAAVRQNFERHAMVGESPVLLTSPTIRPYVRSIVERFRPQTVVMSQNEIHPKARIKTLGQI